MVNVEFGKNIEKLIQFSGQKNYSLAKELGYDGEEVLFLKHMVIAHHGKLEWGSPKEPMIIEAELLHYLDVVSAKMTAIEVALRHCEEGQMSDRIPMLDNRRFYHHK